MNWIRENVPPTTFAKVSTASVLATPGTPSSNTCPLASKPTRIRSTRRSWPTMMRFTSKMARSRFCTSAARAGDVAPCGACGAEPALPPVYPAPPLVALVMTSTSLRLCLTIPCFFGGFLVALSIRATPNPGRRLRSTIPASRGLVHVPVRWRALLAHPKDQKSYHAMIRTA